MEAVQTSQVMVIAEKIDQGLEAFEVKKSELIELTKEADGLKITSIDDRKTINAVSNIRKKLKAERVDIQKQGKAMRDPLTQISRMISEKEKEKELVAITEPVERDLEAQENWVESEKERIRKEAEEKERARIHDRINQLSSYGVAIDYTLVSTMPDDEFTELLNKSKSDWEAEQAAKIEAARQEALERERMEKERKELEELRAKQQAEENRLAEERRKIEEEKQAIERARIEEENRKRREVELEQARKEAAEKARMEAIEQAKREQEAKERAEAARIEEEKRLEEERKAAEARALELRPDKDKLLSLAESIIGIQLPELKSKAAKGILDDANKMLVQIADEIKSRVQSLK